MDETDDDLCPTTLKDFKVGEFFLRNGQHPEGARHGAGPGAVQFIYGVCAHGETTTRVKMLGYFRGGGGGQFCGVAEKLVEDFDSGLEVEYWENTWIGFGEFWA